LARRSRPSPTPRCWSSVQELIDAFDFGKTGRAPPRYDQADLERINAQVLHAMPYAEAQARLAALDADLGEAFWLAIRGNLAKFADVAGWAKVVAGPIAPVVEDAGFLAQALELLPDTLEADSWQAWAAAIKDKTGAKGRALFMPLRQALTGQSHGPEMGPLLTLIGREKAARRLAGETA
jgi:glutamyl-tRNA synthetase